MVMMEISVKHQEIQGIKLTAIIQQEESIVSHILPLHGTQIHLLKMTWPTQQYLQEVLKQYNHIH